MLNVLIVDDSAVTRRMINRTLQMSGLEVNAVHEAGNGQEALDILGVSPVDLALVDVNMPTMNGEQLVTNIRATPGIAALPIVMVSTEGSETRIARLQAMGAEFIHKPFDPSDLHDAVMRLLGESHAA